MSDMPNAGYEDGRVACATGMTVEQIGEKYGHEDAHAVDAFKRFLQQAGRAPCVLDHEHGIDCRVKVTIDPEWGPYARGLADDRVDLLPLTQSDSPGGA